MGADWWTTKPPAQEPEVAEVQTHRSIDAEGGEFERNDWFTDATIHVLEANDARRFTVTTHGISQTKIGFFSPYYLAVGLRLSVTINKQGRDQRAVGVVRSCVFLSEQNDGSHKIVLEFSEDGVALREFLGAI